MNVEAHCFYGLMKLRRENAPIRPIVAYTDYSIRNVVNKLNAVFVNYKIFIENLIQCTNTLTFHIPHNGICIDFRC